MNMASKVLLTLTFVREGSKILLGFKKYGFGSGKWNGFGGKVEPGETIKEAAKRELTEECGLVAEYLNKCGVITFEFVGDPKPLEVHVFVTDKYTGKPTESNEMIPRWYEIDSIPFGSMWLDDQHWFPLMLSDKKFHGYFIFEGQEKIQQFIVNEVKESEL